MSGKKKNADLLRKQIVEAAAAVKGKREEMNLSRLSAEGHLDWGSLKSAFEGDLADLAQDIGLVRGTAARTRFLRLVRMYAKAAAEIRKDDDLPTYRSLARKTGKPLDTVEHFFARHPEVAKMIGVYSESEALVFRTGWRIIFQGGTVTRQQISLKAGCHYQTVRKVLYRNPDFLMTLRIKKSPKGSGPIAMGRAV